MANRFKRVDSLLQIQIHTFLQKMFVYECRHGIVHRSHHLVRHLDYRHVNPRIFQVLRHLQPYKPGSDNNRPLYIIPADILLDTVRVIHIAKSEYPLFPYAFQRGYYR